MSELRCSKCDATLSFGGASATMRRQMTQRAMLEGMADMVGWRKVNGKWECRAHG